MATVTRSRKLRWAIPELEGSLPWLALGIDLALRVAILVFAADTWLNPTDERYQGKNLGGRSVFILVLSLLFPFFYVARREWPKFPIWWDALYLSVFAIDMAGNYFGLYLTNIHFDHIPHLHGPGALAVVLAAAFGFGPIAAAGLATMLHTGLEVNEFYSDVYMGTKNVRDLFDSMNDLTAGLLGVGIYLVLYYQLRQIVDLRRAARPKQRRR